VRLSPKDAFQISFIAFAIGLAGVCALLILVCCTSVPSGANVIMEGTSLGSGTSDFDLHSTSQSVRMGAYKSEGVDERYSYTQTKGDPHSDSTSNLDAEMSIDKAGGTRKTMFQFWQKNKAATERLMINGIVGEFVAETAGKLTVGADGALSYDLDYRFNGKNLSYIAQAVIMDEKTGRPATDVIVQRSGNWTIWNHLNVTTPIVTPESWLGSCEDLNKDIISDETVPDSIFVMPKNNSKYNYYARGKKIISVLNTTS
jgi:hypothetical protein